MLFIYYILFRFPCLHWEVSTPPWVASTSYCILCSGSSDFIGKSLLCSWWPRGSCSSPGCPSPHPFVQLLSSILVKIKDSSLPYWWNPSDNWDHPSGLVFLPASILFPPVLNPPSATHQYVSSSDWLLPQAGPGVSCSIRNHRLGIDPLPSRQLSSYCNSNNNDMNIVQARAQRDHFNPLW